MINECNIVRDLLPLYVDKASTDDSEKFIRRHLAECEDCQLYYKSVANRTLKAKTSSDLPLSRYELLAQKIKKRKLLKEFLITGGFVGATAFCLFAYLKNFKSDN